MAKVAPDGETGQAQRSQMDKDGIPSFVWSRNLAEVRPPRSVHKAARPPVFSAETLSLLPLATRLGAYVATERARGRDPFFDLEGIDLRPPDPGPFAGVPLGGVGCGSINRGFRGDFRRWNVLPGRYIHKVHHGCQFALRVRHSANHSSTPAQSSSNTFAKGLTYGSRMSSEITPPPEACVLVDGAEAAAASRSTKELSALRNWGWKMKPSCATYHALYPRAWTVYEEPLPGVRLICRQVSPVLGSSGEGLSPEERQGEYVESSLPCAVFEWRIENLRPAAAEVSLMLSWEADAGVADNHVHVPQGSASFTRSGGKVLGVEMRGRVQSRKVFNPAEEKSRTFTTVMNDLVATVPDMQYEDPFSYAIACSSQDPCPEDVSHTTTGVTCCPLFSTAVKDKSERVSASCVWAKFLKDGGLQQPIVFDNDSPDDNLPAASQVLGKGLSAKPNMQQMPSDGLSCTSRKKKTSKCGICCCSSSSTPMEDGTGSSAVCQHVVVPGLGHRTIKFALSWDIPLVRFGSGKPLARWYTRFCGVRGDAAPSLAAWALRRYEAWEERIAAWQAPVLKNPELPAFYKNLVFNELYYVSDGGSLWTDISIDVNISDVAGRACLQNFGKRDNTMNLSVVDTEESSLTSGVDQAMYGISSANSAARACGGNRRMVGQFLYLEGHEYLMYNTYDVHFYASWALIMNWPQLQLSLQYDLMTAIMAEDKVSRVSLAGRALHYRKVRCVVPHDVGSPSEEPWLKVNSYNLQDVSAWKDLGPKFVLQVYRDYRATNDIHYLRHAWPTVLDVMKAMEKYDRDADGLIENDGFPDQTYDIWTVTGASAYTGGIWVAALSAVAASADALLLAKDVPMRPKTPGKVDEYDPEKFQPDFVRKEGQRFKELWQRARHSYVMKLWNERNGYFNYDNSGSEFSDSCMSDQCAGQWWACACGLPSVCDEDGSGAKASRALLSVLDLNVYRFGEICARLHCKSEVVQDGKNGTRTCFLAGAVNGMRPPTTSRSSPKKGVACEEPGQVDNSCVQSREVWTGVSYGLASAMLQESRLATSAEARDTLRRGAFDVAKGIYIGGWQTFGYWFATPEAWEASGNVRCMGYMRPLSVWAMQWALSMGTREDCSLPP